VSQDFEQAWSKRTKDRQSSGPVCFDRALLHDLEVAEENLAQARTASEGTLGNDIGALQDEVRALRELVRKSTHSFTFESLGRRRWRELMSEHPPTDEQKAEAEKEGVVLDFNFETFPALAMEESCVQIDKNASTLTAEQAQEMLDELPEMVSNRIWTACINANVVGGRDPFDLDSETPSRSGQKSRRQSGSGSRARSSSAGS
jgi:hypothetical protein